MPLDPESLFPDEVPGEDASQFWGDSASHFDVEPFQKTAGGPMEQAVRSLTHSFWAGSQATPEQVEIEENIKELIEEGRNYVMIEKYLKSYGYKPSVIRRSFQKLTGIDPVLAYLDVDNYSIPPAAVPRYNYGWGHAKDAKADYYFIMPLASKFAVYKQVAFDKSVVDEDFSITGAREKLKELVKDVLYVSPGSLDTDTDIIQRVASINIDTFENPEASRLSGEIARLKSLGAVDMAEKMVINASMSQTINDMEFKKLMRYVKAEPAAVDEEDPLAEKQFEMYKRKNENKTLDEELSDLSIPKNLLNDAVDDDQKLDLAQMTQEAYQSLSQSLAELSYEVTITGQSTDAKNIPASTPGNSSYIHASSVNFVISITNNETAEEAKGLVIMFMKDGSLQNNGIFTGKNDREYALSDDGISSYFNDLGATPIDQIPFTPSRSQTPANEPSGPYK